MTTNNISKVLIVDDDTFYLFLLKTILKDIGADIYMADSGTKALSLIKENDFALAILDIQMPVMDGFELATQIRNLQKSDLVPIIFLTSYFADEIQMFKGYGYGAIDFLTKPVNKTIFISKVKIFLELDRQKRKLIESEELYHSLLRTSPDGIILTNLEGKIIEASDVAIELLGANNRFAIEGSHYISYIPKISKRTLVRVRNEMREYGLAQNIEIVLSRIDQTQFIGEISTTRIKGTNDDLKAYMAVIRNISERKILEKQIRHSERMAGIGELATGMAHEINQPLNTISLSIDNIIYSIDNKTINDDYLKTKINKVFDNIFRIKKIIDHVRTFSRDQDDFVQLEFDINNSIKSSISMVSEQMYHKDIGIAFHEENELPKIKGNTHRFEQVIINLLVNAKDALEEKKKKLNKNIKKRIEISTKLIRDQIVIEVKDNGIGIKPEEIDKILLPFYTTKDPGFGTGLGLSISYGIIKELNGEIEIQSEVLKGTTIRIIIPVHTSNQKK